VLINNALTHKKINATTNFNTGAIIIMLNNEI